MKSLRTQDYSLWQNFLLLAGRVLMGWIFVDNGWRKLTAMDAFIASLANRRVPYASVLGCDAGDRGGEVFVGWVESEEEVRGEARCAPS